MEFKLARLHNAPLIVGKKQINNKIITNQRVKQNFHQRAHSKGRQIDIQIIRLLYIRHGNLKRYVTVWHLIPLCFCLKAQFLFSYSFNSMDSLR